VKLFGDLLVLKSVGGKQNDLAAHGNTNRAGTLAGLSLQFRSDLSANLNRWGNTHREVSSS
jgi:hypothetical protein